MAQGEVVQIAQGEVVQMAQGEVVQIAQGESNVNSSRGRGQC